ncbi:beta-N-acetylhexosaminidase [Isoptericola jiangsuensis]|uniref:Beta-N-acetylhexosaminidase n=1 Tax=Isoptericola jiangsuensis TaxID=548579 RepID=A0A2A9F081_9MICO|nr:glycoside hydrolase family 3 N-terminal domain-containing protein [Isoptericola jiangsuensis]PFG43839.1 beta-N-acetylhexosaminidase [Isoptericola jiangsuensis]
MTATHPSAAPDGAALRRAVLGVLLPGFSGTTAPDWLLDAARDGLAGVVLFGHNTPDVATTARLTAQLHDVAPDLLVTIDEEGGDVTRLEAATGSSVPSPAALGTLDDVALTGEVARALGGLLAACGVDLDLAPVLDVDAPANPVIGTRAFGDDTDRVSRHGRAVVEGLHAGGVGVCAKHFPGHGSTTVDSHVGLPRVTASVAELRERDLVPYVAAHRDDDAGPALDAVMVAHVVVPELGPGPASLEPATVALARELGMDGPVITDALDMRAVSDGRNVGEAAVRAVQAGADLLCLGTTAARDDRALFEDAVAALTAAVSDGRVTVERLAGSAARTARCAAVQHDRRARTGVERGPEAALRALDVLRQVGRRAARATVSRTGESRLSAAPLVVDLRRRTDHAAGDRGRHVTDALAQRWPGTTVVGPDEVAAAMLAAGPGQDGHPVVLLTREPPQHDADADRCAALLAARPDAVVLHTGVASALEGWLVRSGGVRPDVVLTLGAGRATADAAVDLLGGTDR